MATSPARTVDRMADRTRRDEIGIVSHASYVPRYALTRAIAREAWPSVPMAGRARSVLGYDEERVAELAAQGVFFVYS